MNKKKAGRKRKEKAVKINQKDQEVLIQAIPVKAVLQKKKTFQVIAQSIKT